MPWKLGEDAPDGLLTASTCTCGRSHLRRAVMLLYTALFLPLAPFCADMRASFCWLLDQSGPVLTPTRCFTWTPGVGWQRQADADAAAAVAAAACVREQLSLA